MTDSDLKFKNSSYVNIQKVEPGSIIHIHNISFGDEDTAVHEFGENLRLAIGHDQWAIVLTDDGDGAIEVWSPDKAIRNLEELLAAQKAD